MLKIYIFISDASTVTSHHDLNKREKKNIEEGQTFCLENEI